MFPFWEVLEKHHGRRVLISLLSDDLREFAYDGHLEVETEGPSASASLMKEGNLFIWLDEYSAEECVLNISHREQSEYTGLSQFLCTLPLRYDELLVRVVEEDGSVQQVWPLLTPLAKE